MFKKNLYLALLTVFSTQFLFAQVSADFTTINTDGCGPLIVQFNNLSTGSGTLTYTWNLGNGNTSTATNPSATYITPGLYTVTLTVSNGTDTDTETKVDYIEVFAPPVANFSADDTQGCFPLPVQFTDLSVPGSSPISSWIWDFGDGTVSTDQNPTHTYPNSGSFNVTLLLTDANGCFTQLTVNNYISVGSAFPTVAFTADPLFSCDVPQLVSFTNTSSGSGALTYAWDFGDGGTSTAANPTHSYTAGGVYTVSLTATDPIGCAATATQTDYITVVETVNVDFSVPNTNVCANAPVNFTDLTSPPPATWLWNFGDGQTSTDQNPSHVYTTPGTYSVRLIASYTGNCSDTLLIVNYITVADAPAVSFSADQTTGCELPFTVNYNDNSTGTGPFTYQWNFGDGIGSTDQNPQHTYTSFGNYGVALTVTNTTGCSVTTTQMPYIQLSETTAAFEPDVYGFCIPLTVNFTDLSTSGSPITSWQWNFDDGTTSTLQNPTHTFTDTGLYTITLIIENAAGCIDTLVRPNIIFAYTPPGANFTGTPNYVCAGEEVQFTDLSLEVTDWSWDFGDGTFSTEQNPIHTYGDTGYFSVTLIALNNGCTDTLTFFNYVYVRPAVAEFEAMLNCDDPYTVVFDNNSIAADSYSWDFGDGSPLSNEFEPTHTYLLPGYYEVELTVTSDTTACIHTENENFTITDPLASFAAANTSGCGPLTVSFTESSTDAVAWYWNFGDGSTTTEQNPTHIYTVQGTYDVSLTVTDLNGCSDTLINLDMVVVTGSIPDFEIASTQGCDTLLVQFSDLSSPPGSVLTWFWDFGDGTTSTQQNPSHIYQNAGTYDVSLTISDDAGCTNTNLENDFVNYIPYPTPDFLAWQNEACPGEPITFNNLSSPDAVSFVWDFGDGTTSTDTMPTHAYAVPGVYTVSLSAANSNGCDSSATITDYIIVETPDAAFTAFPTVAFCPPLLVNFTDQSAGNIVAWQWFFGDGTFSTVQNPSHVYTIPGLFDVTLIITNSFGCTDTVLMPGIINLSGPTGTFSFAPDSAGCLPFTVTFEAASSNATTFTWDFGDGNLGNGQTAAHQYTQSGNFFPSLILQDANGCSFVIPGTGSISVSPLAVDAGNDVTICREDSTQLQAAGGTVYAWNPTTGLSNPNIANPVASPSVTTKYYVTVTDGDCSNIDSVTVTVGNTATAAFDFNTVCAGDTTYFTDLSLNGGDSITSWTWNFGDGITSALQSPSHLYAAGGTYNVSLSVATQNGCGNSDSTDVIVHSVPAAAFSAPDVCLNDTSIFTDLSTIATGSITSWNWTMSDGTIFFTQNPNHFYSLDSTFTVSLVVTGTGGCSDSTAQTITIHPLPVADFSVEDVCITQLSVFSDSTTINSGSIANYQWTFGNGNTSNQQNPTQIYAAPGTYTITLLTTSDFGCVDSTSGSTTIFPNPVSNFAANSDSSCTYPVTVGFSNSSTGATLYDWTFGNGGSSQVFNPSVVYDTSGNYLVTLIATNQFGCSDTSSAVYNVYPIPVADFSVSATEGCQPLSITFDSGLTENALTYSWTFNNGSTSTDVNPTTVYTDPGVYSVNLTVVGEGGCIDSVSYANIITVFENPTAAFDYHVVNEPNIDGTTEFTNLSSPIISSHWDFGDGGSSNEMNPTHQFGNYGSYPVMLIVTDFRGCIDTALYNIFVDFFSGLWVPNAFIPQGGEGHNLFLPKGTGLKTYRMQIFDTWGNLLFETDKLENGQPAEGWNGIHKGELLPQNAYVWHITARFGDGKLWQGKLYENGQQSTIGSVTLLR
ncbi:MAG: hypothetical protein POELPBGB_00283 [Bacteroidia bacterium]|nr:hypothetical protein [Bacteroidia bacterium]